MIFMLLNCLPEVHAEFVWHLLEEELRELECADDDLEVARGEHAGDLAGDAGHAQHLEQQVLARVVHHPQEGLQESTDCVML